MKDDWVEIFRAGTHTDSKGRTREWTEEDLDRIVSGYDPRVHEAPVVLGHPKDNFPAYGWVEAVKREGKTLLAKFRQLVPEFVEAVRAGRYKKRSVSLYGDGSLRHVGFLGAVPPAVKGLADVAFQADAAALEYEFTDGGERFRWALDNVATLFQRIRDLLIEKFGAEEAERAIPQWQIKSVEVEPEPAREVGFSDTEKGGEKVSEELMQKVEEMGTQLAEFQEREKTLAEENAKLKRELSLREINSRLEKLQAERRITPGIRELGLAEFIAGLSVETFIEFGEGEKAVKRNQIETIWSVLEALPVVVEFQETAKVGAAADSIEFKEFAGVPVDEERMELHKQASLLAREKGIPYASALAQVLKK